MRLVFVLALTTVALVACSMPPKSMVPDNTLVMGFDGVNTPQQFWMRQAEREAKAQNDAMPAASLAYRECTADQIINVSPPTLNAKVERFVQSRMYGDYYDLIDEAQGFLKQFQQQRGMDISHYAQAVCESKGILPS